MKSLFELNLQLLHNVLLLAINVFVLFVILSYVLFEPIRKIYKDRKYKIKKDQEDAEKNKLYAKKLKYEYIKKLENINQEADIILSDAIRRANLNEEHLLKLAKKKADQIKKDAYCNAELEKERVKDDIKKEIILISTIMASKIITYKITDEEKDKLLYKTLDELGNKTWIN